MHKQVLNRVILALLRLVSEGALLPAYAVAARDVCNVRAGDGARIHLTDAFASTRADKNITISQQLPVHGRSACAL